GPWAALGFRRPGLTPGLVPPGTRASRHCYDDQRRNRSVRLQRPTRAPHAQAQARLSATAWLSPLCDHGRGYSFRHLGAIRSRLYPMPYDRSDYAWSRRAADELRQRMAPHEFEPRSSHPKCFIRPLQLAGVVRPAGFEPASPRLKATSWAVGHLPDPARTVTCAH